MIQRTGGREAGFGSEDTRPLSVVEPREHLTARGRAATEAHDAASGATDEPAEAEDALRALPYHDGLALIAQERRGLHAVRHILGEMLELATSSSWPATSDAARVKLQIRLRGLVSELREFCAATRFRGMRLLDDECAMVGIQDGPDGAEFLVLGLPDLRPEVLGVHALDLGTGPTARVARKVLRDAVEMVEHTEAVVVHDLHELLGAARVNA